CSWALVSCMQRMSASWARNQSKKPLLAAERMPLALKLTMRMVLPVLERRTRRAQARRGPRLAPPPAMPGGGGVRSALGARRAGRARRQDRVLHLRLAPGQRAQEGGDRAGLVAVELAAQLRGAHDR